ncbi:MAG: class I SAM-dependent methyltransferase [Pseudomonadota bacterium]
MSEIERQVSAHYTTAELVDRILAAVAAAGGAPDSLAVDDLKGVDEFHTGGVEATDALLSQLAIQPSTRVLDIGCGIGGTSRHIAAGWDVAVTGVDLTVAYVAAAEELSRRVGLAKLTSFLQGSALDLPVASAAFDLATMFHVGMNIDDKAALFREAARVLAPGGTFALFDVMRVGPGEIPYPMPWAEEPDWSFVAAPALYREAASSAGLALRAERNRAPFAKDFFERVVAAAAASGGPPPVSIHLLMRETAAQKLGHYVQALEAGTIAPVEMIFHRP